MSLMSLTAVELGKKIKKLRLSMGYTQEKLSEMADISQKALSSIEVGENFPVIKKNTGSFWPCIIPKKEESKPEPKYVPFKNSGEFISEFEDNTPIMHIYGLWIYEKIGKFDERVPRLVTEMWGDGVIVGSDSHTTKWKELLERFVFENNEPCGKLQEEK